jgi:hypothetical protein
MCTYAAKVWDLSVVQGPFCVAPCQNPNVAILSGGLLGGLGSTSMNDFSILDTKPSPDTLHHPMRLGSHTGSISHGGTPPPPSPQRPSAAVVVPRSHRACNGDERTAVKKVANREIRWEIAHEAVSRRPPVSLLHDCSPL